MNNIETLKLALEYLQDNQHHIADNERHIYVMEYNAFIERLERIIAEAEQAQPVACPYCHNSHTLGAVYFDQNCAGCVKRMTAPPPRQPWVGLTRTERFEIEKAMSKYYDYQHECKTVCLPEFANAIEAKLKEKNT